MSNTVITNYTDLNGPSTKADSSVVVIVNKDGSLSVDQNLLGTLMGTDGTQAAGISVVRVGHEGKPDDATDSESEDDKIPHVTLSVDSYYNEPNSIIKYDSGAEMLQSLRIETRENSLVGFQNDHCYTTLTSPSQGVPQRSDSFSGYDDPVIEITNTPPPRPVPQSKKIVILEEQIIPKGKKIVLNPTESSVIIKGNDVLNKPLPVAPKAKQGSDLEKSLDSTETSSISSGESIPDRDSDSDYKDANERSGPPKLRKLKTKPRILKSSPPVKGPKMDTKAANNRLKTSKSLIKRDIKDKSYRGTVPERKASEDEHKSKESPVVNKPTNTFPEISKVVPKPLHKPTKKEKKTPAHVSALLSDMTSLFSVPDVIRRVSTDGKPIIPKSESYQISQKSNTGSKISKSQEVLLEKSKPENADKLKNVVSPKPIFKDKINPAISKNFDLIPQLDDASLAQILQDTNTVPANCAKVPSSSTGNIMNSPGLAGPLSPTLDLLGGLQPEEEGLSEDLLMHVAQLVESSENLQEVIDKQVLGKVDNVPLKPAPAPFQQNPPVSTSSYVQTPTKSSKQVAPRKEPIEIVCRDGRVITLPPIEAPTTRSSKRKSQIESSNNAEATPPLTAAITGPMSTTPEPQVQHVSKQYINRKLAKKIDQPVSSDTSMQASDDKISAESQESWNSEDDPYRLWCICKQPHNNRFMICCDSCEDWFHGKCVNITKAMGQQMEEQGIEWRCPNCIKKTKVHQKVATPKPPEAKRQSQIKNESFDLELSIPKNILSKDSSSASKDSSSASKDSGSKTSCIVCKKLARASSIYCSDACILKHAQDSLGPHGPSRSDESGKPQDRIKADARVTVYERKTGKLFAGLNAPTAENLKTWLQQNPTFEVVRPGVLRKPSAPKKKPTNDPHLVQTTLNYEKMPRKLTEQSLLKTSSEVQKVTQNEPRMTKFLQSPKPITPSREVKASQPKTPVTRSQPPQWPDTPRPSTSTAKISIEQKKVAKPSTSKVHDKASTVSPSTSRRKEAPDAKKKMDSEDSVRENVRKSLQEQMSLRMAENSKEDKKFTEAEIRQFAMDTEAELHELFRDTGMKYKAKYRSLMFNIKDRKNLSLWRKIRDGTITPKQLVRLSPEELASQELAEWRDQEAKHQLELIKKSELDLLAASKTYVLKTHKGEEVMQTKESVSTELDPNVPVEDVVVALNEAEVGEEVVNEILQDGNTSKNEKNADKSSSKKRERDRSSSRHSKKKKRDSERRESRSSRRKSDQKEREERSSRRSERKRSSRARSPSKERTKKEPSKEKSDSSERTRHRSRSRGKSRRRSKSKERSRSKSRDRSRSHERRRRSSRDEARRRRSSRSKHVSNTDEKPKQRSKSQENVKGKNDSTDSDSIERPKSALQREVHPEYDPHEPMITSAFSEEDLRKSGAESCEESYSKETKEFIEEYDPTKYAIDTNIVLPSEKYIEKQEKLSEPESDQEPSSTVENAPFAVWNGCINMVDVARFYVAAYEVSGNASDLEEDLSAELDIVGRINPDTVWEYISKMKRAGNKDILVLKLQAANDEEKMQYIALYSYLSSRNRLGVVKVSNTTNLKDFYIVPLAAQTALPAVVQPVSGPGLGAVRTHLLVAIVIRQRRKRPAPSPLHKDVVPAKVGRESRKRSYTPPILSKSLPLPAYTSPALSTSVKDKIAASLAAADEDEAYSPGSSSSGGSGVAGGAPPTAVLLDKMEQINRQIEEQKKQILKMAQADSSVAEDEAYSPSRPMTPPPVPLADIALPSNLHEILATIKQRSEVPPAHLHAADVDMRNLPPS